MSGTTTKGYPYILGSDSADTIDDTSLALANKLEAVVPYAMAAGTVSITLTAASTGTATVTFPTSRFSVAPIIECTKVSGAGAATGLIVMVPSLSSTGATIGLYHPAGTTVTVTVTVHWWAVQMTTSTANG